MPCLKETPRLKITLRINDIRHRLVGSFAVMYASSQCIYDCTIMSQYIYVCTDVCRHVYANIYAHVIAHRLLSHECGVLYHRHRESTNAAQHR